MAKDEVYEKAAQKAGWGPSKSARERSGMRSETRKTRSDWQKKHKKHTPENEGYDIDCPLCNND